jgi:hypothetical protein
MKTRVDCIALKRQGAERLLKIIGKMTRDEELAFWKAQHEEMLREQHQDRSAPVTTSDSRPPRRSPDRRKPTR